MKKVTLWLIIALWSVMFVWFTIGCICAAIIGNIPLSICCAIVSIALLSIYYKEDKV